MGRGGTLPGQAGLTTIESLAAGLGLLVGIAMSLMKVIPAIPGHFTVYEWLALGIWIGLGVISHRRAPRPLQRSRFSAASASSASALRALCLKILNPASHRTPRNAADIPEH